MEMPYKLDFSYSDLDLWDSRGGSLVSQIARTPNNIHLNFPVS
jgi:hypothetical protein